jgi:hypothetical protein
MTHITVSKHARDAWAAARANCKQISSACKPLLLRQQNAESAHAAHTRRTLGHRRVKTHVVEVAHDRRVRRHGEGGGGVVLGLGAVKSGEHLRTMHVAFSEPHRTASLLPARVRARPSALATRGHPGVLQPGLPQLGPPQCSQANPAPSGLAVAATRCALCPLRTAARGTVPLPAAAPRRLMLPAITPAAASPPQPSPRPP